MLVVYPDADSQIASLITEDLVSNLKEVAELKIFEGRPKNHEEYLSRVQGADVILLGWDLPNDIIKECKNLKLISFTGIGYKNYIDVDYAAKYNIAVTNTPGYADNAVAEQTLALLFSVAKNVVQNHENTKNGLWDQSTPSFELMNKTIGIIGVGGIGGRMIALCKAMGMNVICWTFNPSAEREKRLGVSFVDLETLLKESDVISIHLPYSDETHHFLGEKELSMVKPGSIFINTSRAELVDTSALVKQLESGRIAGAGLDVFDEEPIFKNNPLLKLKNVVLSPHIGFNTQEATEKILEISITNIVQFIKGSPENVVNKNNTKEEVL